MMAARKLSTDKTLAQLLPDNQSLGVHAGLAIESVCSVSQQASNGSLFLACKGRQTHGLRFIEAVINSGAIAVLWEPPVAADLLAQGKLLAVRGDVALLEVPNLTEKSGEIAARFYDHPSHQLTVVGVTGTNGKTSCAHYIAQALSHCAHPCGVIGTLGMGTIDRLIQGSHTTPDAVSLQQGIARLVDKGLGHLSMEVSSHALDQGRVNGVEFDVAVWTNLSRDHLDYHPNMQAYADAKKRLFEHFPIQHAVINIDDEFGKQLALSLSSMRQCVCYSKADKASERPQLEMLKFVCANHIRYLPQGVEIVVDTSWGSAAITSSLLGSFNVSNLLAALATVLVLDIPFGQAVNAVSKLAPVAGRMERFSGTPSWPTVIVDYAHTPAALAQSLEAVRMHFNGRIWCVFGCGGNRDTGKRPLMGEIAARLADHVVITDDNPRQENGDRIIAQIVAGIGNLEHTSIIRDRPQAIHHAITQAQPGDVVLVAGKGHETLQWVGKQAIDFSDRAYVQRMLAESAS